MTRDLTEKNLVEKAEVFADISNVNLYDGRNVIQPENLELLPQEMHYKDSEGKPAKVMADVRMRWRKNGSVIAMIQIENQSEINNIMPIRDLGYIFNNYNEQIKEHQRENERNGKRFYARELGDDEHLQPVITFVLYYGKEEWKRPLSILDMLDLDETEKKELEPFLLNHKIHLISLSRLDEKEVEKYKSDFWHVIKFLTLHGYGKTRKYLEEESGKRKLKHPEEVQNVLYALSSDKRFLEADLANDGKEEPKMGQISDVLDQIEAIMFDKGVEQGIERGVEQERKHLQRVNQLHAELIKDDRTAELFQATQDPELQEKLMKEYGIE